MSRTLLVDPAPSGHRAFYLSLIAAALGPDRVHLLVPAGHRHLTDCFVRRGLNLEDFRSSTVNTAEASCLIARAALVAREHDCGRVFFAYLDSLIEPLLTLREGFPLPVTGIWFHPYALDRRYRWLPPIDKRMRHRRTVHHELRGLPNGLNIERLFFLDPIAAVNLRRLNSSILSAVLPDPWEKIPELDRYTARARFGLPQDRQIFLHIGSSEKRKGLADTLAAFDQLAKDPSNAESIMLLRVGENDRLNESDRKVLISLAESGLVRTVDGFVPEADFIEYFAAADWILLPYRNFRHSSGILSNALAAGRPVIASDYGLIADTVRNGRFGLLFSHGSPRALSMKIREAVETAPPLIDPTLRQSLHPDRFVHQLSLLMMPAPNSGDAGKAIKGVSVVLCCYNSSARLPETLRHLSLQKLSKGRSWEVVVVDNASNDDSALVASKWWQKLGQPALMTIVCEPSPGLSAARSAGISAARYEYLVFCDDDNWLAPDYLEKVYANLSSDPFIGCLGGRNLPQAATRLPDWFGSVCEMYAVGPQGISSGDVSARRFVFGAGMALRKSVWNVLVLKGYRSFLSDRTGKSLSSGGDAEICAWHLLEGFRLHYDENLILTHFIPDERLNHEYVASLKKGMILSNGALRMYHSMLDRPPDERRAGDFFCGAIQLILALALTPFHRKAGTRKLAKSQIFMGSRLRILPAFHSILAHYSNIIPSRLQKLPKKKTNYETSS